MHIEAVRSIRKGFNFSMCLSIFQHILSGRSRYAAGKQVKGTSRQTRHQSGGYGKTGRSVPADDQSDRAGGLFTVGNAGAEAGKDLSGNRGRYFQLYGGRE